MPMKSTLHQPGALDGIYAGIWRQDKDFLIIKATHPGSQRLFGALGKAKGPAGTCSPTLGRTGKRGPPSPSGPAHGPWHLWGGPSWASESTGGGGRRTRQHVTLSGASLVEKSAKQKPCPPGLGGSSARPEAGGVRSPTGPVDHACSWGNHLSVCRRCYQPDV